MPGRTSSFVLTGARFEGAQNAGADFRIAVSGADLAVRRVTVTRKGWSLRGIEALRD